MLLQDVRDKFPEDYRRWQQCPDELRMVVPQDREQGTLPSPSPVRTSAAILADSIRHAGETILIVGITALTGFNQYGAGISPSRYHPYSSLTVASVC